MMTGIEGFVKQAVGAGRVFGQSSGIVHSPDLNKCAGDNNGQLCFHVLARAEWG
jgi:hypothetical protein